MNYAWLLALPYMVNVSTHSFGKKYCVPSKPGSYGNCYVQCSESEKDFCYDLAQALNDAHGRRNTPSLIPITDDKGNFAGWK